MTSASCFFAEENRKGENETKREREGVKRNPGKVTAVIITSWSKHGECGPINQTVKLTACKQHKNWRSAVRYSQTRTAPGFFWWCNEIDSSGESPERPHGWRCNRWCREQSLSILWAMCVFTAGTRANGTDFGLNKNRSVTNQKHSDERQNAKKDYVSSEMFKITSGH